MRRLPLIFPGQASQSVGMAADLAAGAGPGGAFLREVDGILDEPLTRLMAEGPLDVLTQTRNAQPAILAHSVAAWLELGERGVGPAVVAGHSLGEFSAAVAAGALGAADALRLVRRRGELMYEAGLRRPGAMSAVLGLERARVEEVCADLPADAGTVVLANHNSALQAVISGDAAAVAAAAEPLLAAGARRVVPLTVSGAFHSPLLAEAAAEFAAELDRVAFRDPAVPLVANVDAEAVRTASELVARLKRQMTSPVLWHDVMARLLAAAPEAPLVLEVGPGQVLSGLARREHRQVRFAPAGTAIDLERVPELLAGEAG